MKSRFAPTAALGAALVFTPLLPTVAAQRPTVQGPTQADLNAAATNSHDWLVSGHDYSGARFVDLKRITPQNAGALRPVCIYQTGFTGAFQAHPIVYAGVMYITAGPSTMAIDAATCKLQWRHDLKVEVPARDGADNRHRGVALKDGMLVRGAPDGRLLALEAASGKVLWERKVANDETGETLQMPPVIFDDLVIIGPAGAERGVHGWVGAFRLKDGSPVWKFFTIPKPGHPAAASWSDSAASLIGGGTTWAQLSLDPTQGIVYAATANPWPDFNDDQRKGDNLYSNSLIALDARTGAYKWHYQVTPHDFHDWDLTHPAPWFSTDVQGRRRNVIVAVGKEGLLTLLDRDTHERLWQTAVSRRQNVELPLTVDGVYVCPAEQGGVQWNGPAYNPGLNLLFAPTVDWCGTYRRAASGGRGGGFPAKDPWDTSARGVLWAVDASTGAVRWKYQSQKPMLAAITTTSSGVLFTAELTGDFLVLNAKDGSELYRFTTGASHNGGIATYELGGKQYVAVMAGDTSTFWPTPPAAGNVIVFALP